MLNNKNILNKVLIFSVSIFLLNACGGGDKNAAPVIPEADPELGPITGVAILGPLSESNIVAYDFSKGSRGERLSPFINTTFGDGSYEIELTRRSGPILVCIANGSYIEPASVDNAKVVDIGLEELCAAVNYKQSVLQAVQVTFFTHIAYGYANSLIQNGTSVVDAINQANTAISDWVETDIITVIPPNMAHINSASINLTAAHKYGFANAAISSLMNELNSSLATPLTPFSEITSIKFARLAFDDIKDDGLLDGKTSVGSVAIGTVPLTINEYRNRLAQNILTFAESANNKSAIITSNTVPDLQGFKNNFESYSESIFSQLK